MPGSVRRVPRLALSAACAAALLLVAVAPAAATIVEGSKFAGEDHFSYDDCGFVVDGVSEFEGQYHIRAGKNTNATAFFLHEQVTFLETHVRASDGATIYVSANRLFQETQAIRLTGNEFAFRSTLAGQPFTVTSSDGRILVRDRGSISQTLVFDTEGDDVPGGIFVEELDLRLNGPHPGFDVDFCGLFDA